MTGDQKTRDRRIRGMRSCDHNTNCVIRWIKRARDIIRDLERYGPAGLLHINILSGIIGKSIRIWNADGTLNRIVGEGEVGQHIDIEYHVNDTGSIGHWTLRCAKDPDDTKIDLNSCLFTVIGSQTGHNPSDLRRWTVLKLKDELRALADRVDEIVRSEEEESEDGRYTLMIGGAHYGGVSARDAMRILDLSQNAVCYGFNHYEGHPRGHVSNPSARGETDSVENYSAKYDRWKTGFLTRADQDLLAHLVLTTVQAEMAMAALNKGSRSECVEIPRADLIRMGYRLPLVREYRGTVVGAERDIASLVMVLRHHAGKQNDPYADVLVYTFYAR